MSTSTSCPRCIRVMPTYSPVHDRFMPPRTAYATKLPCLLTPEKNNPRNRNWNLSAPVDIFSSLRALHHERFISHGKLVFWSLLGLSLVSPWSLLGLSLVSLRPHDTLSHSKTRERQKRTGALEFGIAAEGRKLIRRLRLAHRSGQKRKRLALFLRVPSHQSTGGVFASCVSRPHFALSTCVRFRRHFSLVTSSTLRRTTRRRRTLGGNGRGRESRARADFSRLRDGRWDFRQDFGQDPRVQLERCVDFAVLRSARDRHRRLDIRSTARRSSPMMASVFLAGGCLARAPKTGQGGSKPRRDGMTKRAATWVPVQSRVGIDA